MSLKQMQILDSTEAVKQERPAPCARHCEANAFQIVIKNLKAQLAQPEQEEKLPPVEIGVDVTNEGAHVVGMYVLPDAVRYVFYSEFHFAPQRKPLTHEQRFDVLTKFEPHKHEWHAPAILIDLVEAAHGIKENT